MTAEKPFAMTASFLLCVAGLWLFCGLPQIGSTEEQEGQFASMSAFDATSQERTAVAVRMLEPPDSDGFPSWSSWVAPAPLRFNADWQGKNADPERETEVRLLWTPETLFVRFQAKYRVITVFPDAKPNGRRDQLWDRDVAEVFLQPDPFRLRLYKEFEVSPNGFWIDLDIAPGEKHDLKSGLRRRVTLNEATKTWVAELAAAAAARHCHMLDAPVTGSKSHASTGELLFLVGGDKEVLERVRPVFAVMGRGIIHLGAVGSGALMKLINNFLNGVQAAAFAEAWVLVERLGLETEKALDVITNGAPGSPIVKALSVRMANRDYQTNFHLRLMEKDLMYVIDVANQEGFSLRSAQPALELFRLASQNGWGDKDFAAVIEPLREIALSEHTKD